MTVLDRRALDADPFPRDRCDALFAAVLVDDEVDADAGLPAAVRLDYAERDLAACFRLCRQLWYEGFDRALLLRLIAKLIRDRGLDADDARAFKHVRAKFKHFRYAHALYGQAHRYPLLLDKITIVMGRVQDAYRNRRPAAVLRNAVLLRLMLSAPAVARLRREADRLALTTPAAFRRLLEADVAALADVVARAEVGGRAFHHARKIVGRQVSFWDTLRTIEPTPDRFDMSRSLSAINGLMGARHDEMIERRATDRASYARAFVLPAPIRSRIEALIPVYRVAR